MRDCLEAEAVAFLIVFAVIVAIALGSMFFCLCTGRGL